MENKSWSCYTWGEALIDKQLVTPFQNPWAVVLYFIFLIEDIIEVVLVGPDDRTVAAGRMSGPAGE